MNDDNQVQVVLLKPHRHLGVQYIKGDVISVASIQLDWLLSRGVARVLPTETKQDKKS